MQNGTNKFLKSSFVNINGEISNGTNAKISIFDRGFLYGDSIYEVTYGENYKLIFLQEHIDRLYNSANLLKMKIFYKRDQIINEVIRTLKYSKLKDVYIRIILTRGETEITLDPNTSTHNNLIIIVKPKTLHSKDYYTKGLKLYIPETIRNDIKSVNPNAKSGNYLNNVLAMAEAKKVGADDAVMINHNGEITEGTTFNIWMIKDGILITPPVSSGLLKGITREKIIEICQEKSIPVLIKPFKQNELLAADEVFICSSTRGIMPVYQINNQKYGSQLSDWPMIKKIVNLYQVKIQTEMDKIQSEYK